VSGMPELEVRARGAIGNRGYRERDARRAGDRVLRRWGAHHRRRAGRPEVRRSHSTPQSVSKGGERPAHDGNDNAFGLTGGFREGHRASGWAQGGGGKQGGDEAEGGEEVPRRGHAGVREHEEGEPVRDVRGGFPIVVDGGAEEYDCKDARILGRSQGIGEQ
jgi:hypothetical protein